MGMRLLQVACVTGYSRVPDPPARMIPLCGAPLGVLSDICSSISRKYVPIPVPFDVLARVLFLNPMAVGAARDFLCPVVVFKIPSDRLANPALKSFCRSPL